jgi:hypothetical protein
MPKLYTAFFNGRAAGRKTGRPLFLAALIYPSNRLCDVLHITGEAERGVVRMLINTLFWTTLGVFVVWFAS